MITKKQSHPRSDDKHFEVVANQIDFAKDFFRGQGRALVDALVHLSQSGKRTVQRKKLREYLETNRKDLFPGTSHKDPWRIFEIYHRQLVGSKLLRDVD